MKLKHLQEARYATNKYVDFVNRSIYNYNHFDGPRSDDPKDGWHDSNYDVITGEQIPLDQHDDVVAQIAEVFGPPTHVYDSFDPMTLWDLDPKQYGAPPKMKDCPEYPRRGQGSWACGEAKNYCIIVEPVDSHEETRLAVLPYPANSF